MQPIQPPFDLKAALRHLKKADPILAKLIKSVGSCAITPMPHTEVFAALGQSIIYQQLAGKAAATIFNRVKEIYPHREFPSPSLLLATDENRLRQAGLSRNKLAALQDLAQKCLSGQVPSMTELQRLDNETIVQILTQVRGIGRWTVEMLLIFRLGRMDVWPIDDYGLRRALAVVGGLEAIPSPKQALSMGDGWRPYRSIATWYLWRALD